MEGNEQDSWGQESPGCIEPEGYKPKLEGGDVLF